VYVCQHQLLLYEKKVFATKQPRRCVLIGRATAAMQAGALLLLACCCLPVAAASSDLLTVIAGTCELTNDGTCVTDGPGDHGNGERCSMRAEATLSLSGITFNTQSGFDYVTIGSTRFNARPSVSIHVRPFHKQTNSDKLRQTTTNWYSNSDKLQQTVIQTRTNSTHCPFCSE
jgi:hypothetical protein